MNTLELHYCQLCGWEEKSYELAPRECPRCGSRVFVGEPTMSALYNNEKLPDLPKAAVEAEALLTIRDMPFAHETFRKVLLERDQLEETVKRLRVYEEQCNGLAQKFCASLIAEGVPKAIEYIEHLQQVSQSMSSMADEQRQRAIHAEDMIRNLNGENGRLLDRIEELTAAADRWLTEKMGDAEFNAVLRKGNVSPYEPLPPHAAKILDAAHERIRKLEGQLSAVKEAVEYAGNRWDEWGERAVTVAEMLDAALEVDNELA